MGGTAEGETDAGTAESTGGGYDVRTVAIAVTAGVFLGGVATGVAFPTLPLLDRVLGISAVLLGVILAANRIARLLMNTPAGSVIDSVGARKPMIAGLFVQGLAPFGYVAGLYTPPVELGVVPVVGSVSAPVLGRRQCLRLRRRVRRHHARHRPRGPGALDRLHAGRTVARLPDRSGRRRRPR